MDIKNIKNYFISFSPMEDLMNHIKSSFWTDTNENGKCFSCNSNQIKYKNKHYEYTYYKKVIIYCCQDCIDDMKNLEKNKQLDFLINPVDNISKTLRNLIIKWINIKYHHLYSFSRSENTLICCICNQIIKHNSKYLCDHVPCLSNDIIAHYNCILDEEFSRYFTNDDYNYIILNILKDRIIDGLFYDNSIRHKILDSMDFPVYVDIDEIYSYFKKLKGKYWIKISTSNCTFCDKSGLYQNIENNLNACETCHSNITSGNIDIIDVNDKLELNNKLRDVLCNCINHNYYELIKLNSYFEEYGGSIKNCEICLNTLDSEYIAICPKLVAHEECIKNKGAGYTKKEYDNLIYIYFDEINLNK